MKYTVTYVFVDKHFNDKGQLKVKGLFSIDLY
jgi:hypothetical protein